jgi:alginate O-acetyltransferase complex protein AlgI
LQIYGDFSGYSDIARGISRLLGIELMENFKQPYLSRNITEFWRRWHISLSTWLRDYLYIPLGGNRKGTLGQYRNLMVTMLLGGLWHGAGWNFILWGALHGFYLSVHKLVTGNRKIKATVPEMKPVPLMTHFFWAIITFNLVCLTFVPFRLAEFSLTLEYFSGIVQWAPSSVETMKNIGLVDSLVFYGSIVLLLDILCWRGNTELPFDERSPWWLRSVAYACALVVLTFIRAGTNESFIYFQF